MPKNVRSAKIEISVPATGRDPGILLRLQEVVYDEAKIEVVQTIPRTDIIHAFASKIAAKQVTFKSPITGETMTMFIGDLAEAIGAASALLIGEKYGATPDEEHRVWIE